ncbi:hypothetical protein SDC9_175141 [bioreactor metagenome]|uniref:Integrase catalytic domain-containing protein n=1 Tax=bioreactor metagenome TaxID=1076179 RepID=A0A645GLE6_9ZZZZ
MLDTFSRESLAIYVDKSIKGELVCEALEKKAAYGLPQRIKADNGPEFIFWALDARAYFNKVSWIILVPVHRQTIHISNRSTAAFGMNA